MWQSNGDVDPPPRPGGDVSPLLSPSFEHDSDAASPL